MRDEIKTMRSKNEDGQTEFRGDLLHCVWEMVEEGRRKVDLEEVGKGVGKSFLLVRESIRDLDLRGDVQNLIFDLWVTMVRSDAAIKRKT